MFTSLQTSDKRLAMYVRSLISAPRRRAHTAVSNRKVESGSDWSELVGQIAHIDHVTRFLQLQDFPHV